MSQQQQEPQNISLEQYNAIVEGLVKTYKKVMTPAKVIELRKDCYGVIINSINSKGISLEDVVGKAYAKGITVRVLQTLLTGSPDVGDLF